MNLQFNVDQIAEHVTAGIQAQAAANQAARIGERFTGPVVQAILDESCRSGGAGLESRSTPKRPLPTGLATLLTAQQLSPIWTRR